MTKLKTKDKINKAYEKEKKKICTIYNKLNFIYITYQYLSLIYAFCKYITMFCNVFSKLFGKKEKKDSTNDKKTLENV